MSVTVTLHLWWLLVYLAIGVVLYLPLNYLAWRHTQSRTRFWHDMFGGLVRFHGWQEVLVMFAIQVVAWPVAAWEAIR